jgi:hypothetical protein
MMLPYWKPASLDSGIRVPMVFISSTEFYTTFYRMFITLIKSVTSRWNWFSERSSALGFRKLEGSSLS